MKTINCLYCQTENSVDEGNATSNTELKNCSHCGMALPKDHPEGKKARSRTFFWAFWAIVIFCVVMIIYLPR